MNGISRAKKVIAKPLVLASKISSETPSENAITTGCEIEGYQLKNIEKRDEFISEEKVAISGREKLDGNESMNDSPPKQLEFTLVGFSASKMVDAIQE